MHCNSKYVVDILDTQLQLSIVPSLSLLSHDLYRQYQQKKTKIEKRYMISSQSLTYIFRVLQRTVGKVKSSFRLPSMKNIT